MEPMRIVLLGGSGFVGRAIVRLVMEKPGEDFRLHALVRRERDRLKIPTAVSVRGSLPAIPEGLFPEEPYVVAHFGIKRIDRDGSGFEQTNVRGTRALVDALTPSCRGIIYGSSTGVYGRGTQCGFEEDAPVHPETALSRSLVQAESLVLEAAQKRGISAYCLRPRFILGDGDLFVLPGLLKLFGRGLLLGEGHQRYTVIGVDDLASVVLELAREMLARGDGVTPVQVPLHVGYSRPVTQEELRQVMAKHLPLPPTKRSLPVSESAFQWLGRMPHRSVQALVSKALLIGVEHTFSVRRLSSQLGDEVTATDPLTVVEQAVLNGRRGCRMKRIWSGAKSSRLVLTEQDPLDVHLVGGKLARQRDMRLHSIPLPRFFCLTIHFFEEAFAPIREEVRARLATIDFADARTVVRAARDIQTLFSELRLSGSQETRILKAFDEHFEGKALVAVRASTVGRRLEESEDSADNPFAGMSETFLYVPRDHVIEKVKLCWASGFSAESMVYRQAQGFDLLGFGVGVAIQEMVFAERSFVMFTSNPKTASRETVIVSGYGVGEGVVQDKVAVDHYFVNQATGEVRSEIASKKEKLTLDRAKGHGITMVPCPEESWDRPCLSPDEIKKLVAFGQKIEGIFKAPQDIRARSPRRARSSFSSPGRSLSIIPECECGPAPMSPRAFPALRQP